MQKIQIKPQPDIAQIRCEGNSMYPTLRDGDILFVDSQCVVRTGDIVVYSAVGGRRIVHRLIGIRKPGLIIQGDNNRLPDSGLIARRQLLGKVRFGFRGRKSFACQSGWCGLLWFGLLQLRIQLGYGLFSAGRSLYRLIADRVYFCRFFGRTEAIGEYVAGMDGAILVTVAGRTAARRNSCGEWRIYFPYRLLFSERELQKKRPFPLPEKDAADYR